MVTITLADSGGICSVSGGTAATRSDPRGSERRRRCPGGRELDRQDERRHRTAANVGVAPMIAAATTPAPPSASAPPTLAANARGTWTVGFTAERDRRAPHGRHDHDRVPERDLDLHRPRQPDRAADRAASPTARSRTPRPSPPPSRSPSPTAAAPARCRTARPRTVQILGITSGAAGAPAAANWTVETSADTTARNVGAAPVIGAATTPTAVTLHRDDARRQRPRDLDRRLHHRARPARSSTGDTITIVFPNATSIFTVPASPTVLLTNGFNNCSIGSATGASTPSRSPSPTTAASAPWPTAPSPTIQVLGVTAGAAGAPAAANWTGQAPAPTPPPPTSASPR